MTQNINLLEELTLKPHVAFNSKVMVSISISWILILIFIYFFAYGVHAVRQKTLSELETTQKNLVSKIDAYKQEFPELVEEKSADLKTHKFSLQKSPGFYRYFKDLANLVPHGLWINEIVLSESDNSAIIKGSAIVAASVSTLLNSLSKAESFRNKKFNNLQLYENLETHNTDFTISTVNTIPMEPNKKE